MHNPLFTVHNQYRNEWMRRFYWSVRSKWWCYLTLCTARSTKTWRKKVYFRLSSFAQKVVFGFPSCRFIVLWVKWVYELWVKSWVRSALACITCALLAMRGERWAKRETKGGEKLINKYFIFSSPPPALRAKCRVGLAWLTKRLSCRLDQHWIVSLSLAFCEGRFRRAFCISSAISS